MGTAVRDGLRRPAAFRGLFFLFAAGFAPVVLAQSNGGTGRSLAPELTELVWGLLLIGGFIVAAIVWIAILRRSSRRQLESLRQREAALQEHYQDLFENAHDILFAHDTEGQLTALNRAGEQILGYDRQEAVRLKLTQIIVPEDRAAYSQVFESLGTSTDRGHVEVSVSAKDGRRVVLRINVRRQSLPGRPVQILGIAWDITKRRLAEEALRQSEQRLRRSLEDRIRIGRDLHDGIIQSIYAVGLGLGECRRLIQGNPPVEQRLDRNIADLNAVIRDVRNFIGGLEPEALKGREIGSALQSIAASLGGSSSAEFVFEVDSKAASRLSGKQSAHILQIAREAMTNALRHGRAPRIEVRLGLQGGAFTLEVRDDGTGFDAASLPGTGLGLNNIEGRARELNGHCEICSRPGQGTQLKITIPEADPDADI